ncbi:benzoyl-CoA 2,3-epoxidase subunit BoxA [Afipia broomeae]|uniref:Benzoyl-CoA oxygenase/reductase, BoxA protein n=1 Tax=Afipia broomeae ATCC 49717 TaxID=883078 RepID=K8P7L9_9BRAD|nr:benzoyl-CoA 2,3-epoxidase subunit BoxA [Afipia broomeae]EKS34383.1 benzoyl-CoA oxygenase/reductase, BoxA protein [Afipia broomeae ATCC 49717]
MNTPVTDLIKQHLIDPEICIRCNTCEETCPVDAVTHDGNNYVVDASICNHCMDCISPCPTGSIDNWRVVTRAYSLEEQFSWEELPKQEEVAAVASGEGGAVEALEDEVSRLLEEARKGLGGKPVAPHSASKPTVNLYNRGKPATATVTGNFRLTDANADSDVRHIILDFGDQPFPVLEGQSIGIVAPGTDENGKPHVARLYSVASPRGGEKPNTNNLALTVKREDNGVCSNYLCDLPRGAKLEVTGPFGATFLMPDDPAANIIMICTGTGSAPFRGFTERRRRAMPDAPGRLLLFFGARRPEELPYFGPLQKVPEKLLGKYFCYSRVPDQPRVYVQDRIRSEMAQIAALLRDDKTHVYICGLKGMESGVDEAFADACRAASIDWSALKPVMRESGRYHVETY